MDEVGQHVVVHHFALQRRCSDCLRLRRLLLGGLLGLDLRGFDQQVFRGGRCLLELALQPVALGLDVERRPFFRHLDAMFGDKGVELFRAHRVDVDGNGFFGWRLYGRGRIGFFQLLSKFGRLGALEKRKTCYIAHAQCPPWHLFWFLGGQSIGGMQLIANLNSCVSQGFPQLSASLS